MKMRCLISIIMSIVFLGSFDLVFAGNVEENLRSKGFHVTILTEQGKINLQVNKLEQAVRTQRAPEIQGILPVDYTEQQNNRRERSRAK